MLSSYASIFALGFSAIIGIYVIYGFGSPKKRRRKGTLPGLINIGNQCFLNSVLQSIAGCALFNKFLNRSCLNKSCHFKYTLSLTLLDMIRKLNLQDDIESPCYSAADVIASLRRHRWVISSEEQDAHELYQILMSTVEEELYAEPSICSLFDIKQLMNEEDIHRTFSPFQGLFTNKLSCQICSHKNPLHFDSFNSLSLALPSPSLHPINLYGCLQNFIKAEYVKDIDCKQCSRRLSTKSVKSTFVKQLTFGKVPDCLCIHIQRTIWSNSGVPIKRNDHVNFKQYLCINQFINFNYNSDRNGVILLKNVDLLKENSQPSIECKSSNCCFDEGKKTNCKKFRNCQKCLHELVAVVVHIGDVYSGHYITYRKGLKEAVHSNQSWFMTSDTLVKKVSFSEVLAANAYMLIYERSSQICDNKHHVINSLV